MKMTFPLIAYLNKERHGAGGIFVISACLLWVLAILSFVYEIPFADENAGRMFLLAKAACMIAGFIAQMLYILDGNGRNFVTKFLGFFFWMGIPGILCALQLAGWILRGISTFFKGMFFLALELEDRSS